MDFGSSHVYAGESDVYYSSVPRENQKKVATAANDTKTLENSSEEPVYESINNNAKKASKANRSLPEQPIVHTYDDVPTESFRKEPAWDETSNEKPKPTIPKKPMIYRSMSSEPFTLADKLRMALDKREKGQEDLDTPVAPPRRKQENAAAVNTCLSEANACYSSIHKPAPITNLEYDEIAPKLPPRNSVDETSQTLTNSISVKQSSSAKPKAKMRKGVAPPVDGALIPHLQPPPTFSRRRLSEQTGGFSKRAISNEYLLQPALQPSIVHNFIDTNCTKKSSNEKLASSSGFSAATDFSKASSEANALSSTNPFSSFCKSSELLKNDSTSGVPKDVNSVQQLYPTLPETNDLEHLFPNLVPSAPALTDTLVKEDTEFMRAQLEMLNLAEEDYSRDERVTSLIRPSAPQLSQSMIKRNTRNKAKSLQRTDSVSNESEYASADTNVVCIKLGIVGQTKESFIYRGLPSHCQTCGAIATSKDEEWTCKFCSSLNKYTATSAPSIPANCQHDITYILQPPTNVSPEADTLLVFCVDTSGSMCVASKVSSGVLGVFVSRLQSVKQAIIDQLNYIESTRPHCRVALVTFSDTVQLLGDGSPEQLITLTEFQLFDTDFLHYVGTSAALPAPISSSRIQLNKTVNSLQEKGGTALGPALLLSTALASKRPGSQVIVCTDGRANVGVGSLEMEDDYQSCHHFYNQATNMAATAGVIVSILSIAGTDCRLVQLGKIADKTAGKVSIVEAGKLSDEFANILSDKVLATSVSIDIVTHNHLYFSNELGTVGSSMAQFIGNITEDSEVTFRYGINNFDEFTNKPPPRVAPFQLKIIYRPPDGSVCMRVLTQARPVTESREVAETAMNPAVIGTYATQQAAKLALDGDVDHARELTAAHKTLLARGMSLRSNCGSIKMSSLDEQIYESVQSRIKDVGDELSKVDDDSIGSGTDQSLDTTSLGEGFDPIEEEAYESTSYTELPPALPPRAYLQDENAPQPTKRLSMPKFPTIPRGSLKKKKKKAKKKDKLQTAMNYKDDTAQKMFNFSKAGTKTFIPHISKSSSC